MENAKAVICVMSSRISSATENVALKKTIQKSIPFAVKDLDSMELILDWW